MSKLEQMQEMARERLVTAGVDGFAIDLDIDELNAVITDTVKMVEKAERERMNKAALILKKNGLQVVNEPYSFFKIENKHWFEALETLTNPDKQTDITSNK